MAEPKDSSIQVIVEPNLFREILNNSLPEGGDVSIILMPNGTVNGNPLAMITFTVKLPDGSMSRAQAVITLALLEAAGKLARRALEGDAACSN